MHARASQADATDGNQEAIRDMWGAVPAAAPASFGPACDAALEASCPQSGNLSAHRIMLCDECAAHKQQQLQVAGCTAVEVQQRCTAGQGTASRP